MRELSKLIATADYQLNRTKMANEGMNKHRENKRLSGPPAKPVGRPSLENQGVDLKKVIVDYFEAKHGMSTDGRRRTEKLEACLTLDRLQAVLFEQFDTEVKRSTLYTRLLPRNSLTHEGKRHHDCAKVRLLRPQNDLMAKHSDGHFATATIRYMKDWAVRMGPQCVTLISQDDKARVPLGIPAVHKQTRMAMHLQYKVSLPDHDWVVADRHKLIPSVYAVCVISESAVLPSGPTYVAIRSGKHDGSSASSHLGDFYRFTDIEPFHELCKTPTGQFKPILLVTVDGGPDESPRFPRTLLAWAHVFRKENLDFVMVATHAPGQSAYNAVERRMAPLPNDLSGLVLPYETYGSHLDRSGKAVNEDLEKQNFAAAGGVLAEIWSKTVIANHPVTAEFVEPGHQKTDLPSVTEKWKWRHVQQSRYTLQIRKCLDPSCCSSPRTNLHQILGDGLLPPPVPFKNTAKGPEISIDEGHYGTLMDRMMLWNLADDSMAFDAYCPTMKDKIASQTCVSCRRYFPTKKALKEHRKENACLGVVPLFEPTATLAESDDDEQPFAEADGSALPDEATVPIIDENDVYMARFCGFEQESDE